MFGNLLDSLGMGFGSIPYLKKWKCRQISSYDRTGGNMDFVQIPPKAKVSIGEVEGSGCVSRVWFTLMSRDPDILRKAILRFHWDGEKSPSVHCPFGDFFGVGFAEYVHHFSLLQGMSSGGYFSYWPMPFDDGATFEILNMSDQAISHLYFNIQYQELDGLEKDAARFHAMWRRENPTTIGENYTILDAKGRGHFAGCVLNMQSYDKGSLLFLDGDEMFYVDGEVLPSIHGTGTEDYFQSGWYFDRGCFSAPFHGLTLMDRANARVSAYRFHVPDTIPFQKSIRATIEHGHGNMLQEDYSSVAYWYQMEPHALEFGQIPEKEVEYLIPLSSKAEGYLMSELVADTAANIGRRRILHEAAALRHRLKQATEKGKIPPELEGIDDKQFLMADFEKLRAIVEKVRRKKENLQDPDFP